MTQTILLIQNDSAAAQPLADYFLRSGEQVVTAATPAEVLQQLTTVTPALAVVDLHLPEADWLEVLRHLRQRAPGAQLLMTNRYPDFRRELLAKQLGCQVFLRQPFTDVWIERALDRLTGGPAQASTPSPLPTVRWPVRLKIILPFALLAGVFALAAAYLIGRYVTESIRDRFDRQLLDAATLTADWMVREESRLLETLRLVANTAGVAEALAASDATQLRLRVLPIAANSQEWAVELLAADGVSALSLRRTDGADYAVSRGDATYTGWPFVQAVLAERSDSQGDKFAGVAPAPWGAYFYVAGPVFDGAGRLVGAVLVGKPLDELAREIRANTLAHVTFYTSSGERLASTLPWEAAQGSLDPASAAKVSRLQATHSLIRTVATTSAAYSEALGPWAARNGEALGLAGTALAQNFLAQPTFLTQLQSLLLVLGGLGLVAVVGWVLASHITRPLNQMVRAAREVAQGNFQVKLQDDGNDEVAVLVHAFNQMIAGLQEGSIYRDLLGRTVSPEVREELRESFASGNLRLEGQAFTATVLMSDIRGFTTLSEKADPALVLRWLNEYFSELAPVIAAYGGVVDKFEGDALLAFFGVLPRPLPARESAFQACRAALEMLRVVEAINVKRAARGEPLFVTGIGINTGPVTAGGLGAADRMNYTIIGDTVNTTQRLEDFTRAFGESGVIISQSTCEVLRGRRALFQVDPLGGHMLKGKSEPIAIYRLRFVDCPAAEPALEN